jgi:hypothetical protein
MCGEPLPYGRATAAKQSSKHHHDTNKSSSGAHTNTNIWIDTHDESSNSDEHARHHGQQKKYAITDHYILSFTAYMIEQLVGALTHTRTLSSPF